MKRAVKKRLMHERRKRRIRGKLAGDAARPRLSISRSHKQIYVQVIDDIAGRTLCASSSLALGKEGKLAAANGGGLAGAREVGADVARRALEAGIRQVCFDRSGYRYHGRVKALADAAREAGLSF